MKSDRSLRFRWEIVLIVTICIVLFMGALCDILSLYDNMIGADGLKNVIFTIVIRTFYGMIAILPVLLIGLADIIGIMKKTRKDVKNIMSSITIVFLTIAVCYVLFTGINRTRFNEQQYITECTGVFGDLHIMSNCVTDLHNDEYVEYTVNELWFDQRRAISSTGKDGISYHYEYTVSGRYTDDYSESSEIFKSQIGRDDYMKLRDSMPIGFDIKVTVYKNSGFIRSIEAVEDFSRQESYAHLFELSVENGKIIRSEKLGAIKLRNLTWCGFSYGQNDDIKNSLFGINAENSIEFPYESISYDEICLFAVADGKYRRVSNIIYKEDISQ